MNELKQILRAYDECQKRGESCVLGTLVHVDGSHYRKPGARSLIDYQGKITGSIGGGCLDNDLILHARETIKSNAPKLIRYDSTSAEDIIFGMGIGCGGIVDILLEPILPEKSNVMMSALQDCFENLETIAIATVINSDVEEIKSGNRIILNKNGEIINQIKNSDGSEQFCNHLKRAFDDKKSSFISESIGDGNVDVCIEVIESPVQLVVIGGGNDAIPLVSFANTLGWDVTVMDHRQDYATEKRFPSADHVENFTPGELKTRWRDNRPDAVVILTHNFQHDQELLSILLPMELPYLGLLGARSRTARLLKSLEDDGITINESMRRRFHSPVGLDLPAESPAEIALAIVAEIQQELKG